MARITRFAPSPTGPLHLGHAFAALTAAGRGDRFLLRIEDIDLTRCKPEYEAQIYDDLQWLGLTWEIPVLHQSTRQNAYDSALAQLTQQGVTYHCTCTRADIRAALSAPQEGADGSIYPGTCRDENHPTGTLRLNLAAAVERVGEPSFTDGKTHHFSAEHLRTTTGDVILARRDIGTAYHLAVVVDDAAQNITEVTRGEDLFLATPTHVTLQRLLNLPTPSYHHHRLIRDASGRRLAKRDDARALSKYRADGATPQDIRRMLNL